MTSGSDASRRHRKKLDCTPEEFFSRIALVYGRPDDGYIASLSFWLRESERGLMFVNLVRERGEAVCRARNWFVAYSRWWQESKKWPRPD